MMTAAELIELLEGLQPETEIRMAQQPSWPLEFGIEAGALVEIHEDGELKDVFYLSQGIEKGYLPKVASAELGWR